MCNARILDSPFSIIFHRWAFFQQLMRFPVLACRRASSFIWCTPQAARLTCCAPVWTRPGFVRDSTKTGTYSSSSIVRRVGLHTIPDRSSDSTIYALSSAPGRAAIAVIRISGPACLAIYHAICPSAKPLKPRVATVRTLYLPGLPASRDTMLDSNALLLYFQAPSTATGEDVLELHVHGGPAIVKAVLTAIAKCGQGFSGVIRYAEAGEFTKRAFMNDRLDLTQVEALGDTLAADTEQQRRLSVRGATGSLAKQYEQWRQQLLYARGELEALIDFSEDQHFDESPAELCASVGDQVRILQGALRVHSQNAMRGELLRHGISISLLGAPNVGKSSLLNCIVGREAAIVSSEAGTTRDIVEIGVDLGGYFCRFGDTAGLRKARNEAINSRSSPDAINHIEIEGIRRAKARAAESDLVIVVVSFASDKTCEVLALDPEVCNVTRQLLAQDPGKVILVVNKADLVADDEATRERGVREALHEFPALDRDAVHLISCADTSSSTKASLTPHLQSSDPGGMQAFLQGLIRRFGSMTVALTADSEDPCPEADPSVWQDSLGASERHRSLLDACVSHLDAFLLEVATTPLSSAPVSHRDSDGAGDDGGDRIDGASDETDIVLAAEHLRYAADCLAKITGKGQAGDVEEVLGVVFEKFCVGK